MAFQADALSHFRTNVLPGLSCPHSLYTLESATWFLQVEREHNLPPGLVESLVAHRDQTLWTQRLRGLQFDPTVVLTDLATYYRIGGFSSTGICIKFAAKVAAAVYRDSPAGSLSDPKVAMGICQLFLAGKTRNRVLLMRWCALQQTQAAAAA